jgi:spermidine synthase
MNIYTEQQPWGSTVYEIEPDSYISFNTSLQKVELLTNPHFGRMLFLNGTLQSTTSDQELYHGALVSAAKEGGRSLGKVLIAGGAEGWLAEKCFAAGAESVLMVDWDAELVAHCRNKEGWAPGIWTHPRFSYTSKDIIRFCEETTLSFDTVFLDLLDYEEMNETMPRVLEWISMVEEANSVLVMNIGRSKKIAEAQTGEAREILVPSFQEPWYIVRKEKNDGHMSLGSILPLHHR